MTYLSSTTQFNMTRYADDTTIYCDIKDIPNYENLLNGKLCKITIGLQEISYPYRLVKPKFCIFTLTEKVLCPKLHYK